MQRNYYLTIKLFSQDIQIAIVKRASYKCYGPGRWILKEGHQPNNMYLIIEGQVRITEQVYNPAYKIMETIEHCKLYGRQSFGESAVMFNATRRLNSVQSLSKSFGNFITISFLQTQSTYKNNISLEFLWLSLIMKPNVT